MKRFTDLLKIAAISLAAIIVVSCELIGLEKPKPDPEDTAEELPLGDLLDFSDPVKSGVDVLECDIEDGYIAITTTPDKAPKEGDVLASGITESAPLGFLAQVVYTEAVDDEFLSEIGMVNPDGKKTYVAYTVPVSLNKAMESKGIKFSGWMSEIDDNSATKAGWGPEMTILDLNVPIEINNDPMIEDEKDKEHKEDYEWQDNWELGLKVNFSEKLTLHDVDFFFDNTEGDTDFIGFRVDFRNKLAVDFDGRAKWEGKFDDLFSLIGEHYKAEAFPVLNLTPYGIPVVFTFKVTLKAPLTTSLSVGCDQTIFKKNSEYSFGAIWDDKQRHLSPLEGNDSYFIKKDMPIEEDTDPDAYKKVSRFHAVGEAELSTNLFASVGLYGSNLSAKELAALLDKKGTARELIDRWEEWKAKKGQKKDDKDKLFKFGIECKWLTISGDVDLVKLSGKVDLGWEYKRDGFISNTFPSATRTIDSYSFNGTLAGGKATGTILELKVDAGANIFDRKAFLGLDDLSIKLEKEFDWKGFELFSVKGNLLFPDYSNIKVSVASDQSIKVSADRKNPLFGFAYSETACGFTFGKVGTSNPTTVFSDTPFSGTKGSVSATLPIKASELEINVPYAVYPLTVAKTIASAYMFEDDIYRNGVHFIYDGKSIVYNIIDEIPGENL